MPVHGEPLSAINAKQLLKKIIWSGSQVKTQHFHERMLERAIEDTDIVNTLKYGFVDERQTAFEDGTYRYQVCTNKITIVIAFVDEDSIVLISVWRNNK